MTRRRVAITGLAPLTPVGIGADGFWRGVCAGRSATRRLERLPCGFPVETLSSRIVAALDDGELAAAGMAERRDRRLAMGELALRLACDDAGLADGLQGFERSAVVVGSAVGAPLAVEAAFLGGEVAAGGFAAPERLIDLLCFHTLASWLADRARCPGRSLTVSTGCTAGLDAIGLAFDLIRDGEADLVVAGSVEVPLTPVVFAAFDRIGALSCRNDRPEAASRPFDRHRDGFVLAEGAALLVLEDRDHALARGARIYAELCGFASLSNGYHMTNLPADGRALAVCIRRALADAGAPPESVDHVNAHGSSTQQNDLCETNAVKAAFGRRADRMTVNSLKAMIGHALGASNAIEVAACALSLHHGYLFPTLNLEEPGDGCDLDFVAGVGRAAAVERMVKLSSGFSGIHSALVLSAAAGTA